jgi:uncharacterized membrane protein
MKEKWYRKFLKAFTFCLFFFTLTFVIVYLFIQRLTLAWHIALVDLGVLIVMYLIHKRVWSKIGFGKITV